MRQPEFTKGEWGIMYLGCGQFLISFDDVEVPGDLDIDDNIMGDEFDADARLMNAAPKMYAMLRKFAVEGTIDRKAAMELINVTDTPDYPRWWHTDFAHDIVEKEKAKVMDYECCREQERNSLWFLNHRQSSFTEAEREY